MENEKGFSLIEVVIAMLLMGIVAVAFLSGLSTASRGISIADERATAESLARTEMEYVRNQDYSGAPWAYELPSGTSPSVFPTWWGTANHTLPEGYDGYTVSVSAAFLPSHGSDDGEQKITVVVYFPTYDDAEHPNRKVTLEGYRSLRGL